MEGFITIHVPGGISLGIEFAHSAHTGLPVIFSLARVEPKNSETLVLRTGDAITSASSIHLEPSTWEDAKMQLRKAMRPPAAPRELNFVREHTIPASLDLDAAERLSEAQIDTGHEPATQLGSLGMERLNAVPQDPEKNSELNRIMLPCSPKYESNGNAMGATQRRSKHDVNLIPPGVVKYSTRWRL